MFPKFLSGRLPLALVRKQQGKWRESESPKTMVVYKDPALEAGRQNAQLQLGIVRHDESLAWRWTPMRTKMCSWDLDPLPTNQGWLIYIYIYIFIIQYIYNYVYLLRGTWKVGRWSERASKKTDRRTGVQTATVQVRPNSALFQTCVKKLLCAQTPLCKSMCA